MVEENLNNRIKPLTICVIQIFFYLIVKTEIQLTQLEVVITRSEKENNIDYLWHTFSQHLCIKFDILKHTCT